MKATTTTRNALMVASGILVASLFGACSQPEHKTYGGGDTPAAGGTGGVVSASNSNLVTIPVEFSLRAGGLNLLAPADHFTISLEGCATGYTSTANELSVTLQAYKFDRGCKAKLTTFEYNSHVYVPTSGHPFTTWATNDTAIYDEANEAGTYAVNVKIMSQLDDPISGNEAVVYQFSELIKGTDNTLLEASVGASHNLTVGSQPPPSFTMFSSALVDINAQGGGQFEFVLQCTGNIGVTNVCAGVDLSTIQYKLVEDTFTADTLLIGDATTLFSTAGTSITLPGDRSPPGGVTTNGGFTTVTLDGPDLMASHRHMIFIMQANGASYQYFNVDVATLTQN